MVSVTDSILGNVMCIQYVAHVGVQYTVCRIYECSFLIVLKGFMNHNVERFDNEKPYSRHDELKPSVLYAFYPFK